VLLSDNQFEKQLYFTGKGFIMAAKKSKRGTGLWQKN